MNFGEYANVIEAGKLIDRERLEVYEGTVTNELYRYNGGLYSVTKLNENVTFCSRLA